MAEILVHSIDRPLLGRAGLVICVAYANAGGYLKGESHLLLKDESQTYLSKAIRFDARDTIEPSLPIDLAFMAQLAFNEATGMLEAYLSQFSDDSIRSGQWRGATITATDAKSLLNSWVRGEFQKMAMIEAKTESQELRKYFLPITSQPEIKRREL